MKRQGNWILSHFKPAIEWGKRRLLVFSGIAGFALLSMMAAFAITPVDPHEQLELQNIIEQLAFQSLTPINTKDGGEFLREERVQSSDGIASLLNRLGISDPEALEFIRTNPKTQAVSRQMRPGKIVTARTGEHGYLKAFYFPLNGKDSTLVVKREGDHYEVGEHTLQFESRIVLKAGEIRSSLFGATDAEGIPDSIALQIAEIFGGVIDFHRDLRKGDRFSVVYELLTSQGRSTRVGRVLSVEFTNNQKTYTAFLFKTEDGKEGYYSSDGTSLRRAFLRSPLEFSRITSGFSTARFHPILKISRAHRGIDYGAPIGTGVRAVADGYVEFSGWQNGYGNFILLKHRGAFSTAYGHMNGFAPGIKKGYRVNQGEIIGYVGQTGLASGPHLHYEFRVNSVQVNPLATALPEAIPLEADQIQRFTATTEPQRTQLALAKQIKPVGME